MQNRKITDWIFGGGPGWDDLRVFVAVADAATINKAASHLNMSQSTVSRKIDSLEYSLGMRLLERSPSGVEPTAVGQVVYKHARAMQRNAHDLRREISGLDETSEGRVQLIAPDGLAGHWIANHLPGFCSVNPNVALMLVSRLDTSFVPQMQTDVAIQLDECKHMDAIAVSLGHLHYLPYAAPSYLQTKGTPRSLAELASHRILHHSNYRFQNDKWGDKAKALEHILQFSVMTNCSATLFNSIRAGGGIGLLPTYVESIDKTLVPLDLSLNVSVEFWATYHRDVRRVARIRAVVDWLKDIFDSQKYPWFDECLHSSAFASSIQTEAMTRNLKTAMVS